MDSGARRHLVHLVGTTPPLQPLRPARPLEFCWRDYAILLLHVAAEIEHALMVQYLYAAYSLGGPQVPAEKRAAVQNWQAIILGIAKEEMAPSHHGRT